VASPTPNKDMIGLRACGISRRVAGRYVLHVSGLARSLFFTSPWKEKLRAHSLLQGDSVISGTNLAFRRILLPPYSD
jgi:hypothetical protein